MKLEKREISLNETDSLRDAFWVEKMLLYAYVDALATVERRETRKEILRFMQETGEDLCFVKALLQRACNQKEEE
jgi:hypothetical protein